MLVKLGGLQVVVVAKLVASTAVPSNLPAIASLGERAAILSGALRHEPYGITFRKGDPQFRGLVDATVRDLMKSGRINELYAKWLTTSPVPLREINLNCPTTEATRELYCMTWSAQPSHPRLCRQMEATQERHSLPLMIAGEARSLAGYLARATAGLGVGVAGADHMGALRRTDVAVAPLAEPVHFTTYVLHKYQPHGSRNDPLPTP